MDRSDLFSRSDIPFDPALTKLVDPPFFEWFNTIEEGSGSGDQFGISTDAKGVR
jgi:hypothetical protein